MSANADLITVETYVLQGKTIENQFFIYGPKCENKLYLWLFEGLWMGPSMIKLDLYLFSSYPLSHTYVHVK